MDNMKNVLNGSPDEAAAFVQRHFESIEAGDIDGARGQMFEPPKDPHRALDVYMDGMCSLRPLTIREVKSARGAARKNSHGEFVSYSVEVLVHTSRGERAAVLPVWWSPEAQRFYIAARLYDWFTPACG